MVKILGYLKFLVQGNSEKIWIFGGKFKNWDLTSMQKRRVGDLGRDVVLHALHAKGDIVVVGAADGQGAVADVGDGEEDGAHGQAGDADH